ncbi:hypothetical protein ABNF65_02760 [Paenibacillus larvae]
MKLSATTYCFHCGMERSRKHLGIDPKTMKTYCINGCDDGFYLRGLHPVMHSDTFASVLRDYHSGKVVDGIERMLGRTVGFRPGPLHIFYLMKYAEKHEIDSINRAILDIIENKMEQEPLDEVDLKDSPFTPAPKKVISKEKDFTISLPKKEDPKEPKEEPKNDETILDLKNLFGE